jgi:hypothetical protein
MGVQRRPPIEDCVQVGRVLVEFWILEGSLVPSVWLHADDFSKEGVNLLDERTEMRIIDIGWKGGFGGPVMTFVTPIQHDAIARFCLFDQFETGQRVNVLADGAL